MSAGRVVVPSTRTRGLLSAALGAVYRKQAWVAVALCGEVRQLVEISLDQEEGLRDVSKYTKETTPLPHGQANVTVPAKWT